MSLDYFHRFRIVCYGFCCLFSVLFLRLFYLQVVSWEKFNSRFQKQSVHCEKLRALRGSIFDCNGRIFSVSHYLYTVKIVPSLVQRKKKIAKQLHDILDIDLETINKKLNSSKKAVYLKRKIDNDVYLKLVEAKIKGVYFDREQKREYPQKQMACHVVGFIGDDGYGLEGIEAKYDSYLRGKEGKQFYLRDGRAQKLWSVQTKTEPQQDGCDVILTVDQRIQRIVERECERIFNEKKVRSLSVIVMNPQNGDILAMASAPYFDLNHISQSGVNDKRNRAITDIFEPGSTFKIITFASALDRHIVHVEDKIFCENGSYRSRYRRKPLHDHAPHGWLTVHQVLQKSSNIGTVKIAEKVGKKTLYEFIKNFGFGEKTDIDLRGESRGFVRDLKKWGKTSILSFPIGHEIGTTCIQMVTAMSVIANKGLLFWPKIVKEVRQKNGKLVLSNKSRVKRRVISGETAQQLTAILETVVSRHGTAPRAKIRGIRVSGKTGTAQKFDKTKKQYSHRKFFSSFIGFFPVEKPTYCIGVFVDEPQYGQHYGGSIPASLFKTIGENIHSVLAI